ncbi:MAG: aspartate aminotransferase [Bacteroidetes bacterium 4572_77]|nr:MAG: aspartate aminotransferase [Bacteroidetes bacterium 4572_77]
MGIISNKITQLKESATLAMTKKSRELKAAGKDIINLSIGEPDFDTPEFIKDAAIKAINENRTHYTPVPGYMDLREAAANKFNRDNGLNFSASQIVVSTGAKQSISNVFFSILNPGEEVIIPTPYWVSYSDMVQLAEGKPVFIETEIANDFKVTAKEIEAAITPKTKAIIFSSPCNPTGTVYSVAELKAMAEVLSQHPELIIISDEIYEHINFDSKHQSIAQFEEIKDQVVVINGVSKGFAMTGWRIGLMAAPQAIANACIKLQGQTTSGTNSIAQRAAITALDANPKENKEIIDMVSAFHKRRDLFISLLNDIPGFKTNIPQGAFYLFPNVESFFGKTDGETSIKTATDLVMYILKEANVALVSGEAFGDPNCIRFSYATSNENLHLAAQRIKAACSKLS